MATPPTQTEPLLAAIGKRIADLRTLRKLSVAELAEASGFARGYVWRAENGRLNANATTLARFASALGITLAELFEGIDVDPATLSKRPFEWRSADGTDARPKRRRPATEPTAGE